VASNLRGSDEIDFSGDNYRRFWISLGVFVVFANAVWVLRLTYPWPDALGECLENPSREQISGVLGADPEWLVAEHAEVCFLSTRADLHHARLSLSFVASESQIKELVAELGLSADAGLEAERVWVGSASSRSTSISCDKGGRCQLMTF
jgi:hypothetical protein